MKGQTKWEHAWRAFDADIQALNDSKLVGKNEEDPKVVFDEISDEFEVGSSESCSKSGDAGDYEKAWRRLGAWIYKSDPNIRSTCKKYAELNNTLELGDDIWNEIS